MQWACCQYWPIHCEWANLPLTWAAMRVIARIKIGRVHTWIYKKEKKKTQDGAGWIWAEEGVGCGETRLTGSSDMKGVVGPDDGWHSYIRTCCQPIRVIYPPCTTPSERTGDGTARVCVASFPFDSTVDQPLSTKSILIIVEITV